MEVFLQQLRRSFEQPSPETNTEDSNQMDGRSEEGKSHTAICHIEKWLLVYKVVCNVPSGEEMGNLTCKDTDYSIISMHFFLH